MLEPTPGAPYNGCVRDLVFVEPTVICVFVFGGPPSIL